MRDLNEIVTRNATRLIEQYKKKALEDEGRTVTEWQIAGRMAEAMGAKQKSVSKQLGRYLRGSKDKQGNRIVHLWTTEYIEALATAIGKTPEDLVSLDASSDSQREATIAQVLYSGLNRRLTLKDVRALISRLHRLLDHRPLYNLSQHLTDLILESSNRDEAFRGAMNLLNKTTAWSNRRDLHGKRVGDKKST